MAKIKTLLSLDEEISDLLERLSADKYMTKSAYVTHLLLQQGEPKTIKGQQRLKVDGGKKK